MCSYQDSIIRTAVFFIAVAPEEGGRQSSYYVQILKVALAANKSLKFGDDKTPSMNKALVVKMKIKSVYIFFG